MIKQIKTPKQKSKVQETLNKIEKLQYDVVAPDRYMKTRDGSIIGIDDSTEDYQINIRTITITDHDAMLMRYAKVGVAVELYMNQMLVDRDIIIGDEYNNGDLKPRDIRSWGQAIGLIGNLYNYQDKVQKSINKLAGTE